MLLRRMIAQNSAPPARFCFLIRLRLLRHSRNTPLLPAYLLPAACPEGQVRRACANTAGRPRYVLPALLACGKACGRCEHTRGLRGYVLPALPACGRQARQVRAYAALCFLFASTPCLCGCVFCGLFQRPKSEPAACFAPIGNRRLHPNRAYDKSAALFPIRGSQIISQRGLPKENALCSRSL